MILSGSFVHRKGHGYWHPDKPRELWINEVGVTETWRGRGVGSGLLQKTLEHARALGCVEAWVGTEHDNKAALALYKKFGDKRKGTDLFMFTFRLANEA